MIFNQLVEDIREEQCLWSLKSKSKLEEQEDAWRRVAGKNKMSAIEVKLIFRELAKKYKEERKKPKSTWKLLQSLRFLDEDIEPQISKFVQPPTPVQHQPPPPVQHQPPTPVQHQQPRSTQPPCISQPVLEHAQKKDVYLTEEFKVKEEPIFDVFNPQNTSEDDVYVELLEVGDDSENEYMKDSTDFTDEDEIHNEMEMDNDKNSESNKVKTEDFGTEKEILNKREREREVQKEKEKEVEKQKEQEKENGKNVRRENDKEIPKEQEKRLTGGRIPNLVQNRGISILKPAALNNSILKSISTGSNNESNTTGRLSILSSNSSEKVKKVPLIFSELKRKLANGIEPKINGAENSQPPEKQARITPEKNENSTITVPKRMSPALPSPPAPPSPPALPLPNKTIEDSAMSIFPENMPQNQTINISNDIEIIPTVSQVEKKVVNIGDVIPMPGVQSVKIEPADENLIPLIKPFPIASHSRTYDSFGQYVSNTLSTLPTKLANKLEIKILEAIIAINTEKMNLA